MRGIGALGLPGSPSGVQRPQGRQLACNGKRYYKLVAIVVNSVSVLRFKFPSDETIQNGRVVAVEAFSLDDFGAGPAGLVPAGNDAFGNAFLTLKTTEGNEEVVTQLPLERIRPANNSGEPFRVCVGKINPSDCFVEVGSPLGLVLGEVFFIGVHFERADQ